MYFFLILAVSLSFLFSVGNLIIPSSLTNSSQDEPPSEFRENDWDWQKQNRDLVALRSLYGEYPSENDLSVRSSIIMGVGIHVKL